jgi:uncharacterized membrane protein AbrB (regulator of aidB expression)
VSTREREHLRHFDLLSEESSIVSGIGAREKVDAARFSPARSRAERYSREVTHGVSLITTIAAGLGLALLFGVVASRLKLPVLVGYLLAGIVIGPATPGFVADLELSGQLAEIGVMLLMFGVGLHFSFGDLVEVRRIAVPGALAQIAVATAISVGLTWL